MDATQLRARTKMSSFYAIDRRTFLKAVGGISASLLVDPAELLGEEPPWKAEGPLVVSKEEWSDAVNHRPPFCLEWRRQRYLRWVLQESKVC